MEAQDPNDGAIREGDPPFVRKTASSADLRETEKTRQPQPVGRVRRITGLILLILGSLLVARMGWLVAFYWSAFGDVEWRRFAFLSWIGIVFGLTGGWLLFRQRLALWAAIFSVPVFFGGLYLVAVIWP